MDSGIQEPTGGVARYYRSDVEENRLISTEITGYAVSTLVYLHSLTRERDYLDGALRAGRFLTRTAWDTGASVFPFEYSAVNEVPNRLGYFFDTGIIIRGLIHLWKASGSAEFRDVAVAAATSMTSHFKACGTGFVPILQLPSLEPLPLGTTWSRLPGCYQLKSVLAWDDVGRETGNSELQQRFEHALECALASHQSFLPGAEGEKVMDRLHAYCYFLEAILSRPERPECKDALRWGIDRVAGLLREIAPSFARSDVYAQLLRVRLWAEAAGVVPADRLAAEEEAAEIAKFQIADKDVRKNGGLYFGFKHGRWVPHVNPVSTAFGLQAIAMWDRYRAGTPYAAHHELI